MKATFLTLLVFVVTCGAFCAQADEPIPAEVQSFLRQHCADCHGADEPQSQIRLDNLQAMKPGERHLWTLIHEQVATGAMPPADRPRPGDAEKRTALQWIARAQQKLDPISTRRLNRREISAALQDVTGLTVDFGYSLPGDGKVDGFDTGAEALQDAADSVAQLLIVTRRAVDGIRVTDPPASQLYAADVREAKDVKKVFDPWKADGFSGGGDVATAPGTGWLLKPKWLSDRGGFTFRLPPPRSRTGILRLRFVVSLQRAHAEVPNPHLWVEVGGRDIAYVPISSAYDKPQTLEYQVHLSDVTADAKGLSISLTNRVEVPYAVEGYPNEDRSKPEEKIPGGTGLFRPAFDAKTVPLAEQPVPLVVLHSFEIEADYRAAWPPEAWGVTQTFDKKDRAAADALLQLWMERAWRRPVAATEKTRFLALFDQQLQAGRSFDDSLRAAFQAVLMAGSFRYLTAPDPKSPHDQFAIASRLSFSLWGTPPDDELRAAAGQLRDRGILDKQVARMLADPRSDGFFRPFITQWLEMGQPITLAMDHIQNQDYRFGRNLKASMQEETIGYVAELIKQNRPARELVASDWTLMNDVLARHYGYEGVRGPELRRVILRTDDPRGGGILGHAGIQSMLCWMGENWVIYRGAWTLRRILDDPPPPPPLEVPELLPSDGKNTGKTFKQLLQQHQDDSKCAVCHKSMDPLGFAFQNFDLSGRWREREFEKYVMNDLDGKIEWRGTGKDRPVDATGKLPRGEAFASFAECKQLLVQHYQEDLVRGLLKNLFLYTTGRKPEIAELAVIGQIMAAHKPRGYPLREMFQAVVRSRAFLDPTNPSKD